jgi:uncharacterized protein YodC (DUF2158 family)
MTHFDYKPKETTENESLEKSIELLEKSDFVHGDKVRMKGSEAVAPTMVVTDIGIKTQSLVYGKYERKYIAVTCEWFNKGKQDFSTRQLHALCLEKVD